jgi:hypothetical protein
MILTSPTASATNRAVLVRPVLPELATRCTTASFSEYAGSIANGAGAVRSTSMIAPGCTTIRRPLSFDPTTTSAGEPLAEIGGREMEGAVDTGGGEGATKDPGRTAELTTPTEELRAAFPAELAPAHAVARNPSATEMTAAMTGLTVRIRRTDQSRLCAEHGQLAANAIVVRPRQPNPSSTHLRCTTQQAGSRVSDTVGHRSQARPATSASAADRAQSRTSSGLRRGRRRVVRECRSEVSKGHLEAVDHEQFDAAV